MQIAELNLIGKKVWQMDGHKDTIYKLKFGCSKFGKSQMTQQICRTFPLYGISLLPQQPSGLREGMVNSAWLEMDTTASWRKLFTIIESPAVSCSAPDKGD